MYLTICVLFVLCKSTTALPEEPVCSAFDFELKSLETMLRTEHRVEKLMDDNRARHESIAEEFKHSKLEMTTEFEKLKTNTEKQLLDETEKLELLTAQAENRLQSVDNALALVTKRLNDMSVAFSVTNPTKSLVNFVPTFKTIITNIGDGYNMDTGVFTAPVDGLCLFVFTVASEGKQNVYCRIRHNEIIKVLAQTFSDNAYTTASASVYLMLTKGDTVSLGGCYGWNNVYTGYHATTFNDVIVAFSVTNPTQSFVNGVLTFKEIITNTGNGFNIDTRVFTAPVDGLYLFVLTVTSEGQHVVYCWIKHNKTNKVIGRTYSDNSYSTASASIYLVLAKGETLSLGDCGGWNKLYSGNSESTFNGALIKQSKLI